MIIQESKYLTRVVDDSLGAQREWIDKKSKIEKIKGKIELLYV
jgi:hypothetical protein